MRQRTAKTRIKEERENYGFQCPISLKERAKAVAEMRGFGDLSDIAREGVFAIVEKEEKRLGLRPSNGKAA